MLPVLTDAVDPMGELRRFGIDARVAWHADLDGDALVLIEPDAENLARLERWAGAWPKRLVPEVVYGLEGAVCAAVLEGGISPPSLYSRRAYPPER